MESLRKNLEELKGSAKIEVLNYGNRVLDSEAFFKKIKKKIEDVIKNKKVIILILNKGNKVEIPNWFIEFKEKLRKKEIFIAVVLKSKKNKCCLDKCLFQDIDNDFKDYLFNNINYSNKLSSLKAQFNTNFVNVSSTYWTGNICDENADKYILISLNPGYDKNNLLVEDVIKNISYVLNGTYDHNDWINFYNNFYSLFFINGLTSKYYTRLINLFAGMENLSATTFVDSGIERQRKIYKFYDKHLINIDIIPYHSNRTPSLNTKSLQVLCYLNNRFYEIMNMVNCIKRYNNVKKVILNGKVYLDLFINNNINKYRNRFSINVIKKQNYKNINIYDVNINGIEMVILDKFLTSVRGLKNSDLYNIGRLI